MVSYDLPANTWFELPGSAYGVSFQVVTDREIRFKYADTMPLVPPSVDEACFKALPGVIYNSNSSIGSSIWVNGGSHGAIITVGPVFTKDIYVQDQTSRALIVKFNEIQNRTTLAVQAVRGAYTITVANPAGFVAGRYIILFDITSKQFSFYTQIGAAVGNVINLDTPIDYDYPVGTNADATITNMNVDGSTTPRIFGIRGPGSSPEVDLSFDITRIMFSCITTSACTLALFGNLAALTRGLVLRKRNADYENIFNVKTNMNMAGIMFDFDIYSSSNPAQGVNGFTGRLTFNGQNRIGVVIRLAPGYDAEMIIQDNLTTLTNFECYAEGHRVL